MRALRDRIMVLVFVGCACDGDGGGGGGGGELGDSECELAISLTGALEWTSAAAPACLIPFGGDVGISMLYGLVDDGPVERVEIEVAEVTEGEVGEFPAAVTVRAHDGRSWTSSSCVVVIDAHEYVGEDEFSRMYQVTGSGGCATPAAPSGGDASGELEVADFQFRFPPSW